MTPFPLGYFDTALLSLASRIDTSACDVVKECGHGDRTLISCREHTMISSEILRFRLANQHIARQRYYKPRDIVRHLGAVQAQEYPGARWALGMRLSDAPDASIERAFADGEILRTHVM